MTTALRFLRSYRIWNAGEVAGFTATRAAQILSIEPPVAVREGAMPIHGDPRAQHGDPQAEHGDPPDPTAGEPLPDDFPARAQLEAAGIHTWEDLTTAVELGPLTEIDGIAAGRERQIHDAIAARAAGPDPDAA